MNISIIDENLRANAIPRETDLVWHDAAEAPFALYGACQAAPFLRMLEEVAATVSTGVAELSRHTAGVRVRFRTDSPYIAVRLGYDVISHMSHMPPSGINGADLYAVADKRYAFVGAFIPPLDADTGFAAILTTNSALRDYEVNFPLYNSVDTLHIGLKAGCTLAAAAGYTVDTPVVFYGSSITQGGCASRPGNSYESFLSRWLDMDYLNLGFSGSARGEQTMADYIAGLPMSAFVCDYDHNAPDVEHLRATYLPFYRTIRQKRPELPFVMVSRPDFKEGSDALRAVIYDAYHTAVAEGNKKVWFVDGETLFGAARDSCTVDGTHPNDLGFYRMAQGLFPVLKTILCL